MPSGDLGLRMSRSAGVALALALLLPASVASAQEHAPPPAAQAGATSEAGPAADAIEAARVPTYVDVVERGVRLRVDVAGQARTVGLPDPPIRLELDERAEKDEDVGVDGAVLFAWDRPFGVPLVADVF